MPVLRAPVVTFTASPRTGTFHDARGAALSEREPSAATDPAVPDRRGAVVGTDAPSRSENAAPDPLAGLPPDLVRALRDPSIIVPQDSAVFELIAKWANAPSDTASA